MKAIRFMKDLLSVILFLFPGLTADSVTNNTVSGWQWMGVSLLCITAVCIINRKEMRHGHQRSE